MSDPVAGAEATAAGGVRLVSRLHVVVRVGSERFAFAVADVDEAHDDPELGWVPGAVDGMIGQLPWRGRNVSAYDAGSVLGVSRDALTAGALVLRLGTTQLALLVDEVEDLMMVEPGWVRRVPGGSDADGLLSGVYRAPRRQGGLVCIVRVSALFALLDPRRSSAATASTVR